MLFVSIFMGTIAFAWVYDLPNRPILYYGLVFVGPTVFVTRGVLWSRAMVLVHGLTLTVSALLVYQSFGEEMPIGKQII